MKILILTLRLSLTIGYGTAGKCKQAGVRYLVDKWNRFPQISFNIIYFVIHCKWSLKTFWKIACDKFQQPFWTKRRGKMRQSAASSRRQFAAPYRALVNSRFCGHFFFRSPLFFAAPWLIFAAPYILFVRPPLLSRTHLCFYMIFCSSTVVKLDINLPILWANLQNAAPPWVPPASGVWGPVVTPLT